MIIVGCASYINSTAVGAAGSEGGVLLIVVCYAAEKSSLMTLLSIPKGFGCS